LNAGAVYRLAADATLVAHLAFVIFVVVGATLALKWPKAALLHLPAIAWAAFVEFSGHICPLTPLENGLRRAAGDAGYAGGFIEHYMLATLYPAGLTRTAQVAMGFFVVALNAVLYSLVLRRARRMRATQDRAVPAR
jgi:Protein of Unknown function (DUF2784)